MERNRRVFAIITRDVSQKVEISSILYIAQQLRDVDIVTSKGVVTVRGKVGELTERMSHRLVQCHHYLAVNLERVEKMANECLYFDDGHTLKLGQASYARLRKRFNAYLLQLTEDPSDPVC